MKQYDLKAALDARFSDDKRYTLNDKVVKGKVKRGPGKGRIYHKLLRNLLIVDNFSDIHFEPKGNS